MIIERTGSRFQHFIESHVLGNLAHHFRGHVRQFHLGFLNADFLASLFGLPQLHPLESLLRVLFDHLRGGVHGAGHVGLGLLSRAPVVDLGHALDSLGHGDFFQVGVLEHQLAGQARLWVDGIAQLVGQVAKAEVVGHT